MRKKIANLLMALTLTAGFSSCGNSFLNTDYYNGTDLENGLTSVEKISTALNGTYYDLYYYKFAGNYALNIADIPTDISYWNGKAGHFNRIYTFTFTDTEVYLNDIWEYGYKTADNAARIIEGIQALYDKVNEADKKKLDIYMAEAYALRGYAQLLLTNIFAHQIKVNGQDFSDEPGIVVIDKPIPAHSKVSRTTVGKSYEAVVGDFTNAIQHFENAKADRETLIYLNKAAVYGLLARTYLYMEDWDNAISYADKALKAKNISTLTYGKEYKSLYNNSTSNKESFFALAITQTNNWSANSSGTLWSTYNISPSPKLQELFGEQDCRTTIFDWSPKSTQETPIFAGGKFSHFDSGNAAYGTNYIVNAPEMFLILAEANLKSSKGSLEHAKNALLTVAKRNAAIQSVADLPAGKEELIKFLKDERARELFQEGMRLYDLRRWDEKAEVYATGAPNVQFTYQDYQISKLVFPIPNAEINSGFGVEQNEWANTLPQR